MRLSARTLIATIIGAASLATAGTAVAQAARNDYSDPKTWLCKAGRSGDACDIDLSTTIVKADGSLQRETFTANPGAPIDCFYVYPTVSTDKTGNSDMEPGAEETGVIRAQFARFASVCRTYAPMYRQATLTALRAATTGNPLAVDRALGYNDVKDAWNYYLLHGDPNDPRADDINGDVMANGQVNASWGLHLIDVNEAMGNLIDIVAAQGKAFSAGAGKSQR